MGKASTSNESEELLQLQEEEQVSSSDEQEKDPKQKKHRKKKLHIPFLIDMAAASDEFRLVSPGFEHEGKFPRKYTQEGQGAQNNISPPLEWYNVPEGTKSLALVVQDIDAPSLGSVPVPWILWVVNNIPPTLKGLPEGFSHSKEELQGDLAKIREGVNDLKVPGWHGPKLPSHGHRIEFKLYALDSEIDVGHKVTKDKLLDEMNGHVLGEAVLVAIF